MYSSAQKQFLLGEERQRCKVIYVYDTLAKIRLQYSPDILQPVHDQIVVEDALRSHIQATQPALEPYHVPEVHSPWLIHELAFLLTVAQVDWECVLTICRVLFGMKEQSHLLAVPGGEEVRMEEVKSVQLNLRQLAQAHSSWGGFKQVCQEPIQLRIQETSCCRVFSQGASTFC